MAFLSLFESFLLHFFCLFATLQIFFYLPLSSNSHMAEPLFVGCVTVTIVDNGGKIGGASIGAGKGLSFVICS